MLRRRILASAMASVMAIGSVAVVASAEETATQVANVKTKADLEAFVKGFDQFRNDGVYNYGTKSGEKFLDAIEYADNVLANSKSTNDDFTVAYAMLEACSKMRTYSAEELKALVDSSKAAYERQNILNEDLSDLEYTEDSYSVFADAYLEAESVLNSNDSRLITDAFENLESAKNNLKEITPITKADFRAVLKKYEYLREETKKYDDWRRGTSNAAGVVGDNGKALDNFVKSGVTTFGAVAEVVFESGKAAGTKVLSTGDSTTVYKYITEAFNDLNDIKSVNKTTNEDFIAAYNTAKNAVDIFNSWKADDTERATKASVTKLLDTYHKQLVAKYKASEAEALYLDVNEKAAPEDWQDADHMYYAAELKNEGSKGTWTVNDEEVTIAKGISLLKYVDVTSADVTTSIPDALTTNTSNAMEIAEKYLGTYFADGKPVYSDTVYGLDKTGAVTTANGSAKEWTLVYRNLKYALEDEFHGSAVATYSRNEISKLVSDAYDLVEKTGDAAIFADEIAALVSVRQDAHEWLRAANADRKYDGSKVYYKTYNSTKIHDDLAAAIKTLSDKFDKYAYSYGDIYNYIAKVYAEIDAGEYKASDELTEALLKTAKSLSVLKASDDDNDPFTSDREFVAYNRLRTDGDANSDEKALKADYEALMKMVEDLKTAVTLGDVNGDGKVNALDAAAILKAVVNGDTIENKLGDFDANGAVNALDASAILKSVVGA